jgi:hypothetical protein
MKKTTHPCRVVFGLALGILVASASIAAATLKYLPSLKRVPWNGQDTAGGSGGPGLVQWVRDALRSASLALLFGFVSAGLSLPAAAETVFTTQTPVLLNFLRGEID